MEATAKYSREIGLNSYKITKKTFDQLFDGREIRQDIRTSIEQIVKRPAISIDPRNFDKTLVFLIEHTDRNSLMLKISKISGSFGCHEIRL